MLSELAGSLATRSQNCLTNQELSGNTMTHFIGQALTNGDALQYVWLLTPLVGDYSCTEIPAKGKPSRSDLRRFVVRFKTRHSR